MKHIFACACGCETDVEPEVFSAGYVFQCPDCMTELDEWYKKPKTGNF